MAMSMKPEIKAQWLADLRSGEFEQGHNYLNQDGKLCCLGVLCEQAVRAGIINRLDGEGGVTLYGLSFAEAKDDVLPDAVREWAGLPGSNVRNFPNNPVVPDPELDPETEDVISLAELNDGENCTHEYTFGEIADLVEQHL